MQKQKAKEAAAAETSAPGTSTEGNSAEGNSAKGIFPAPKSLIQDLKQELFLGRGETLAAAESCTGGLIAFWLTEFPGASEWFKGGVTAYSLSAKQEILNVEKALLQKSGAVSEEAAQAMARGARALFSSDQAIAVTGWAGPAGPQTPAVPLESRGGREVRTAAGAGDGPTFGKPHHGEPHRGDLSGGGKSGEDLVGKVCFALHSRKREKTLTKRFQGGRSEIRRQAALFALNFLLSSVKTKKGLR